jgi:hypothetical protein
MRLSQGWLRNVVSRFDLAESLVRERVGRRLRRLPLVQFYKSQKHMVLLRELAAMLGEHRFHCYVVGGFAYDGLCGKLTGVHSDIDMAVLHADAAKVISLFRNCGFLVSTKTPYASGAWRDGLHVDLFHWKDAGDGRIQHMSSDVIVRMPEEYLTTSQEVELLGVRFQIPSNEFLVSTLPFLRKQASRKFVASLDTVAHVDSLVRKETLQMVVEATVHEFHTCTVDEPVKSHLAESSQR